MLIRQLILLFPLFFVACGGGSSTTLTSDPQVADYTYSSNYNISEEATKQHPMLVIRMDYANQHFVNNENSWAAKIFGTQTQQLNHYMNEVSGGQFQYNPVAEGGGANDGVVTVYFTTEHPDPDINSPLFASQLHPSLYDAIITVSNYGFDFSLYDDDHNGVLTSDELLIVFIMAGEEDAYSGGNITNGVWAHQWCTATTYTPNVNGVSVMGCDQNGNYAIFGERHHDSLAVSHDATVGIIAHELGHSAFALPDLYDTNSAYGGIGYYGLMANGTWGQKGALGYPGDTPTHMTAWSKIDIGWYSATSISNGTYLNQALNATGTAGYNILKVPISGSTGEYFLVENRGSSGYDEGLRVINNLYAGGIAIWHIDETIINANLSSNSVNDDATHKGVDLEEAYAPSLDTSWGDPVKNLFYTGNKIEFSPSTTPNSDSYYSSGSGIVIDNISTVGNTMTVDITNPI